MSERKQIGLCLIATKKYNSFVQQFVDSAVKFFCINHDVTIILFTDNITDLKCGRISLIQLQIPSYSFPEASMCRYSLISKTEVLLSQFDQLFYSDVDMKFVSHVSDEIFSEGLTAVIHPGYYKGGWGSPNNNRLSKSYLHESLRKKYVAGGFQGGSAKEFIKAALVLSDDIVWDSENGVVAEWHDETHWNKYVSLYDAKKLNMLSPSYCYPEANWFDKTAFEPILIALDKNHKQVRS